MDLLVAIVMLTFLLTAFALICVGLTSPAWIAGRLARKAGRTAAPPSAVVSTSRRRWALWAVSGVGMAVAFNEFVNGPHFVALLPWLAFYALGSYAAYYMAWSGPVPGKMTAHAGAVVRSPAHLNSPVILADETNIFSATDPHRPTYTNYGPPSPQGDEYLPATPTRSE